jgi:cyclic pyranopterin phosphate synthase
MSTLPRGELLSFEEIIRIVNIAVGLGITKIRITGGEPLIRKGVQSLIASVASMPEVQDISLTTNGMLLKKYARELKSAGLKRINVSLDTLREEKFKKLCGMEGVQLVLDGIDEAMRAGISPVKVNTVLIKNFNDDEILDFVNLAIKKGWKQRFIELMPFGAISSSQFISAEEVKNKLAGHYPVRDLPSDSGVAQRFSIDKDTEIGIISPLSNAFCNDCNRLRLTADGKLRGCLMKDYEVDLLQLLRNGCKDTDIIQGFITAVQLKPSGHELHHTDFRKCVRPMNTIGG